MQHWGGLGKCASDLGKGGSQLLGNPSEMDGDWNKELMSHQGRHPYAYHDYVLDNMQKFDRIANGDKTKFLKLYDQMKQKIINNLDMLYKDYWKK